MCAAISVNRETEIAFNNSKLNLEKHRTVLEDYHLSLAYCFSAKTSFLCKIMLTYSVAGI